MYETILHCPNCGREHSFVAEDVVAERNSLRRRLSLAEEALHSCADLADEIDSEDHRANNDGFGTRTIQERCQAIRNEVVQALAALRSEDPDV